MFVHDDGKYMYEKNALKEGLQYTSYTSSLRSVYQNQSLYISTFPLKTDEDQITVPIFICEFSLDADDLAIFLLLISVRIFVMFTWRIYLSTFGFDLRSMCASIYGNFI